MTQIVSCPVCKAPMKEIQWRHVAIDICTRCKGVWLDYGELDAIIETAKNEKFRRAT
ncbi:MAG: Transcription factor zinc-finger [Alphaproteobacteria bacterium]|nr:Transcription factor zinc-finger [Alphaproteobacteria bacterium]